MDDAELADCYLVRDQPAPVVDEFAARIAEDARQDTVTFVARLAERIHSDFPTFVREQGDPWEPERTLNEQRGSCRDLSVLLLDACRSQGLPARFVSGYSWNDDANQDQHLHAWCEVYFPGAGWRGFDPATGLAVSDRHISVAAGRNPAAAAPTSGCFRGDASSRLETQVIVRPDSESPVPTSVDSSGG
jgi:transglutaminase-like putative cysteine protease